MAFKTFKIGEECIGGILKVSTSKTEITISSFNWNSGKRIDIISVFLNPKAYDHSQEVEKIDTFLNEMTTHYHAERVKAWITKQFPQFN